MVIGWVEDDGIRSAVLAVTSSSSVSVAFSSGGALPVTGRFLGSCGGEGVTSGCDLDDALPASLRSYVDREVEKASSKAAFQT
jgi:hypothetical protein